MEFSPHINICYHCESLWKLKYDWINLIYHTNQFIESIRNIYKLCQIALVAGLTNNSGVLNGFDCFLKTISEKFLLFKYMLSMWLNWKCNLYTWKIWRKDIKSISWLVDESVVLCILFCNTKRGDYLIIPIYFRYSFGFNEIYVRDAPRT